MREYSREDAEDVAESIRDEQFKRYLSHLHWSDWLDYARDWQVNDPSVKFVDYIAECFWELEP